MAGIKDYSTTNLNNTSLNGISVAEGMLPSQLNNAIRALMKNTREWFNDSQWVEYGDGDGAYTAAYASATSFTITGVDVTPIYHEGRRIKLIASTPGTIYGTISSSTFLTDTTINVTWDSGSLSNEAISNVYIGALSKTNNSLPTGVIATATLADGSVTTIKIADSAVTTAKINDAAVTNAKLGADSVDGSKIADDSIDSEHYVDGSIDTAHIADSQITTAKIASDAVDGTKIADDSINSEHYADGSIDTQHIADSQISTTKIADSNVTTSKIADLNVTSGKIAADAINGSKIADDSIDSEHIVDGSIDTAHIGNTQVTFLKMAANSIDSDQYIDGSIDTIHIGDSQITNAKMASDSVDSAQYVDGSIDTAHIGDSQVTTAKIANSNITADKLGTDSVVEAKIQNSAVTTNKINDDAVTAAKIADAVIVTNAEQSVHTPDDVTFFTTLASDGRYFRQDSSETIDSGDTWSASDAFIATTGAIDARVVDLVDDVGGFVPIANETSFPNTNPDVNDGAGTIVSIASISSTRTPSSGTVTISGGTLGGSTVTITGCGSTVLTAGFGVLVETTTTLNTYTFHRLVPKATEVTTVASISSDITTVANDETDIGVVSGLSSDIQALADIEDGTTATNAISNVGNNISSVVTTASNISGVNSFAERYRVVASNPTTSLDAGDLAFVTGDSALKFYDGTNWTSIAPGISNVSDDSSPSLGGNLDLNSNTINGTGTINFTGDLTATNIAGAGASITALNASNLASGTLPDARFPATLPAASGSNLTALNASNLASGTVPTARLSGAYTGITQTGTLTSFASTGIDDNATSTAITIDSSQNVSFNDDTGNTEKLIWNATDESLRLKVNPPYYGDYYVAYPVPRLGSGGITSDVVLIIGEKDVNEIRIQGRFYTPTVPNVSNNRNAFIVDIIYQQWNSQLPRFSYDAIHTGSRANTADNMELGEAVYDGKTYYAIKIQANYANLSGVPIYFTGGLTNTTDLGYLPESALTSFTAVTPSSNDSSDKRISAENIRFKNEKNEDKMLITSGGDISFYEDTGTTPKFFWDASAERLGIGTSSPLATLNVETSNSAVAPNAEADDFFVESSGSTGITIGSGISSKSSLYFANSTDNDIASIVVSHAEGSMRFNNNASERMRINSSGNVGIGTSSPQAPLHIVGTSSLSTEFKIGNSTWNTSNSNSGLLHQYNSSTGYSELQINNVATSGASAFTIRNSTGTAMSFKNDGASTFNGKLTVNDTIKTQTISSRTSLQGVDATPDDANRFELGAGYLNLYRDDTAEVNQIQFGKNGTLAAAFSTGANYLAIKTNGDNERMRIDSSGHVTPGLNDAQDLGSTSKVWRNIYTGDLHLSNEAKEQGNAVDGTKGNWTIQEGAEDLYILNNKTGKKFKFKLEEIS